MDRLVRKRSGLTERKILRAAERMFARNGFRGASVHDIAREAGVNSSLIFYYFSSKEKLYVSVVERFLDAHLAKLRRIAAAQESARRRLERLVDYLVGFVSRHESINRILMRELLGLGEKCALPIRPYFEALHAPLLDIIRDGVAGGEFRAVDPAVVSAAVGGTVRAFFARKLITGKTLDRKAIVQGIMDLILNGILARSS